MKKSLHIFTYLLLGINIWFGFLLAQHGWDTQTIMAWGGITKNMPTVQTLSKLPPFVSMSQETVSKLPNFMFTPMHGVPLLLVRALWASFLHFSWSHLLNNMLVMYFVGKLFEDVTHFGVILPVYIVTGIVSMISAYYLQPNALTAGASGALFGLMAASLVLSIKAKHQYQHAKIPEYIVNSYSRLGTYVYVLIVLNLISTVTTPNISLVGHVAGLISGLLIGFMIPIRQAKH